VKVFSWLYFKDRLSTRTNLYAKHILDNDLCEHCTIRAEDKHHAFFGCHTSAGVWRRLNLEGVGTLLDVDGWNTTVPSHLDAKL
jgi:hypothetical protein